MTTEISASTFDRFIWEMAAMYRASGKMEQDNCFLCHGTGKVGPGDWDVCTHMVFSYGAVRMVNHVMKERFNDPELVQLLFYVVCTTDGPMEFKGLDVIEQLDGDDTWREFLGYFLACQITNIMFTRVPELKTIDAERDALQDARECEMIEALTP